MAKEKVGCREAAKIWKPGHVAGLPSGMWATREEWLLLQAVRQSREAEFPSALQGSRYRTSQTPSVKGA